MQNYHPENEWQEGLIKLFGVIDPVLWTVLWTIARRADENGHTDIMDQEIGYEIVMVERITYKYKERLLELGLIKIMRPHKIKRTFKNATGRKFFTCTQRRIIGLYPNLKHGRIPAGANRIYGKTPNRYYSGKTSISSTHKLLRKKFKPTIFHPQDLYEWFPEAKNWWWRAKIKPSPSYRRKLVREKVSWRNQRNRERNKNKALSYKYR